MEITAAERAALDRLEAEVAFYAGAVALCDGAFDRFIADIATACALARRADAATTPREGGVFTESELDAIKTFVILYIEEGWTTPPYDDDTYAVIEKLGITQADITNNYSIARPTTPREGGADALRSFVARIASTRCDHGGEECEEWIHEARALMGRTPRDHAGGEGTNGP